MTSIGEALIAQLEARGVDTVFGIPGVHTVELYRGLAASGIRHVTPRHEQGAGFMADGYARVSGKPGVALVITGPGLTNTLTPMAQARADSVPMLVLSGVNRLASLGKGLGHLHELPDQQGLASKVALGSYRVEAADDLAPALDKAFAHFSATRPGPAHIEIPLDVAGHDSVAPTAMAQPPEPPAPTEAELDHAAQLLADAHNPVILAGGGARWAAADLQSLAERLDAPVIQTVNARGLMHGHPLCVPASPSLDAVRELIAGADAVLALGTELGPTDYDMYAKGGLPAMEPLVRVDICPDQLARHLATLPICGDVAKVTGQLLSRLPDTRNANGAKRAARTRDAALSELSPDIQAQVGILSAIRDAAPGAIIIGDSTQAIYAGNLYYDHDRPGGWFNASTGYGALGYAIPASIGAALAAPDTRVICLTGDGGAQFTLPELMAAVDENLPITFLIWNNKGYGEIETSMEDAGVSVVGCDPTPPDFAAVAASCDMPFERCAANPISLGQTLDQIGTPSGPVLIEIDATT